MAWMLGLALVSTATGLAVIDGRPPFVTSMVLLVVVYIVARHAMRPSWLLAMIATAPAVLSVMTIRESSLRDTAVSNAAATLIIYLISWSVAHRAQSRSAIAD